MAGQTNFNLTVSEEDLYKIQQKFRLISQERRLQSFIYWPFNGHAKSSSRKVAEAGFFMNQANTVECVFCNIQVIDWAQNDNPWIKHSQLSPNCEFIKVGKREQDLTVVELHELGNKLQLKLLQNVLDRKYEQIAELQQNILRTLLDL